MTRRGSNEIILVKFETDAKEVAYKSYDIYLLALRMCIGKLFSVHIFNSCFLSAVS